MVSRSSSYDSEGSNRSSDLFREAEVYIKDKMNNLLGLGYACGIATTGRCKQEMEKSFMEDDVDEGLKVSWRMDPRQSMSDWVSVQLMIVFVYSCNTTPLYL